MGRWPRYLLSLALALAMPLLVLATPSAQAYAFPLRSSGAGITTTAIPERSVNVAALLAASLRMPAGWSRHAWHLHHLAHLRHLAALAWVSSPVLAATTRHSGYPCGDGDGDGYDIPCSALHHPASISGDSGTRAVSVAARQSLTGGSGNSSAGCYDPSGQLTAGQVRMVWECAGGPAWAAGAAVGIATCESGMNTRAYNPSGATGLFQILGSVVSGSLWDAHVNALNAVSKFSASGDSWAQWVCRP